MNVDLVVNKGKDLTGLSCYSSNLKSALSKKISLREVNSKKDIPSIIRYIGKLFSLDIEAILSKNPIFLRTRKNALVHLTNQYMALSLFFCNSKTVVTVHDLILFEHSRKKIITGKKRIYFNKLMLKFTLRALKKADMIIADSEYTKKKLVEMIGYPANKISVIYLGVDRKKFKPLNLKNDPFTVLYVGSEVPIKNLPVLIKAFARLKKRLPRVKFVKVGLPQWPGSREELKKLVLKLGISDSVIFKDYCKNLALEYSKATVFVHPSIYEGFGLPVLEAMACGCPVICSDKTSLPEVAGDAALYFDGYDVEDLADKIYKVLKSKKIQKDLKNKGFKNIKRFSWDKCAKETLEVYNAVNKNQHEMDDKKRMIVAEKTI